MKLCSGAFLLACLCAAPRGEGAAAPPQQVAPPRQAVPPLAEPSIDPNDPTERARAEKMALARNEERQRRLVEDTDRLLALAEELQADVHKSSKDTLSVDVVKKAAAIEKLARSVKDRMREGR